MADIVNAHASIIGSIQTTGNVTGDLSVPKSRIVYGDYGDLTGKPSINSVEIDGEKVSEDYHLQGKMDVITPQEIERILYLDD